MRTKLTPQHDRGATLLELTVTFPVFILLFLTVFELSNLAYTRLNLQFALSEAGRLMVTGQGYSSSSPGARLAAIQAEFCKYSLSDFPCAQVSTLLTLTCVDTTPARTVCPTPGPVSCAAACTQGGGGPGQTVTITASFDKTLIYHRTKIPLTARSTWKNEQFS